MNRACPLCGGERAVLWRQVPDVAGARHPLWECRDCGMVYLSDAAVALADDPAYPPHHTVPARCGAAGAVRAALKRRVLADHKGYPWAGSPTAVGSWLTLALLPLAWQVPRWQEGGRLLDVGCGGGTYLRAMRALGWEVHGVEANATAAARAQAASGAQVWPVPVERADLPERHFHVITLWHVLEHLARPVEALAQLRRALVPRSGTLLLETPNFAGPGRRLFAEHWYHLDPPRHRLAWTPDTLRRALYAAGFHSVRIAHAGNAPGIVGSLARRWPEAGWLHSLPLWWLASGATAALASAGWGECLRASAVAVP